MAAVQAAACQPAIAPSGLHSTAQTQTRPAPSLLGLAPLTSRFRSLKSKQVVPGPRLGCCCQAKGPLVDLVESTNASPRRRPRETRLRSVAAGLLPALMLAFVEADLPRAFPVETVVHDAMISEGALKAFYMIFICVFSWGAVVFASMNDPYYDSDEYRNAGGNGTQHWIYTRAEETEQEAREELWREELRKEIEEKIGDVKELGAPEEEKEKTLV